MTIKTHRTLVALVSGCVLAGMLFVAPSDAPAHSGRYWQPVCLNVTDNGSSVMTLRIKHRYMLEPDRDDMRIVKITVNGAEPAMGLSMRTGQHTVILNVNGSVAGFFTAMQLNWNTSTNSGTGRLLGELSVHPTVQLTSFTCP